jgi:CheY-like chemotaxis protein
MHRILVIDDQSHVRTALALALSAKGFDVVAVESGQAALKEFDAARFDVAVVDVFMPKMDGVQLIKALRERKADLPVIAISGVHLGVSDRTALDYLPRASGLPGVMCLKKPFRPSQLVQLIGNAVAIDV